MSIDSLLPEQIEINTSGQYVLYCRHYPDTPEAACSMCVTQDTNDSPGQFTNVYNGGLMERIDFSGHNDSKPHINYDLIGASGSFSRRALGDVHKIDLDLFKK